MVTKTTLRIPDRLMRKLRERSQRDGLSVNETVIRALERAVGDGGEDDRWLALGSLLERPPMAPYEPEEFDRLRAGITTSARDLEADLDWVRGDRL